ncbi:variant erythrocyte surface antigen-1 family protein [Babesia caballi]|uniref:Variant erythrocyte surface antigen-1 family protein n=1 Tax=Babesia caballi TaxID=5871 RepID=A0AAV4M1L3_BABCB|nr:variant erythrocyte surface antigen-1 family protein [Babesia caballi]
MCIQRSLCHPSIFHYSPLSTPPSDCPSDLKEAIDWILRVTGNDGGGSDNTAALARAVKSLLQKSVQEVDGLTGRAPLNDTELSQWKDGLSKAKEWLKEDLTAVDATIAFTIGVLEGCKKHKDVRGLTGNHLEKVNSSILSLYDKYDKGPMELQKVASTVQKELQQVTKSNVGSFVRDIGTEFAKLKGVSDTANDVAGEIETYLKGVFKGSGNWTAGKGDTIANKLQQLGAALQQKNNIYDPHDNEVKPKISEVNTALGTIKASNAVVNSALSAGKQAFIWQLQKGNYTATNYEKLIASNRTFNTTHAKIFLGCLPLIFNNLSYFYWQCRDGGAWRNLTLGGGDLRSYFDSQGLLSPYVDTNKRGVHIAYSALKGFSEFSQGMTNASSPPLSSSPFTYVKFTKELQKNVTTNGKQISEKCPLSALFHGASCYFRYQQFKNAKLAFNTPKTIREMLYFLAALQFSPQYDEFDRYVTGHFKTLLGKQPEDSTDDFDLKLQVADSGTSAAGNTLSVADLKSHLLSTFIFIPGALGVMQGPSTSGEPWLYHLFCNGLNLAYPSSGAIFFSTISNYAYALQFQLHFLYQQCSNTYTHGCGWRHCRYGEGVNNGSNNFAPSHICNGYNCTEISKCNHDGTQNCNHNKNGVGANCGQSAGKASPLQAFLTDCLPGFSRGHPSDPSSHLATCSGSLCHVPMGFNPNDLRAAPGGNTQGENICLTLRAFCGGFNTPLRQLSEKLGCLTKRTPRTLGDMFGFVWHLKGQLYNHHNSNPGTHNWVTNLADLTPFSSTVKEHINVLQTFVGIGHNDPHPDLTSLYNSKCDESSQNCGPYLYPLTHSDGATFGKPAPYASTYLSWVLYLTDDLYESLQALLDTFNGHACKNCTGCSNGHSGSTCKCPSVVDCGDVLPHLYANGFRFLSAFRLKGMKWVTPRTSYKQTSETKRTCANFHSQLQSVIAGNPLTNLLTSIDAFLYAIRWEFFSKLSAFWTIYICLILYTFFFLLDTLRVRSHLHFPSSNSIAPISLLGTGKAPALRTFTKLTYFIP